MNKQKVFVSIPNNLYPDSRDGGALNRCRKALEAFLGEEFELLNDSSTHDLFDWRTNADSAASCLRGLSESLMLLSQADIMLFVTGDNMKHDHITKSELQCARRYEIPIVKIEVEGFIPGLLM